MASEGRGCREMTVRGAGSGPGQSCPGGCGDTQHLFGWSTQEAAGNEVPDGKLGLRTVKSQAKQLWAVTLKPWATNPTALST